MTSFNDFFNTSFFMSLGISILLIAACIVYFESKMRDQNHKIASMLSLVSSIAEELNFAKLSINNLTLVVGGNGNTGKSEILGNTQIPFTKNGLIDVSDSEPINDSSSDDEEEIEEDEDFSADDDSNSSDTDDEDSNSDTDENNPFGFIESKEQNISLLKNNNFKDLDINDIDIDPIQEIEPMVIKEEKELDKELDITDSEKKIIKISDNTPGSEDSEVDLKKCSLSKLKEIAINQGIKDSHKMKKPELLQLLEEV